MLPTINTDTTYSGGACNTEASQRLLTQANAFNLATVVHCVECIQLHYAHAHTLNNLQLYD